MKVTAASEEQREEREACEKRQGNSGAVRRLSGRHCSGYCDLVMGAFHADVAAGAYGRAGKRHVPGAASGSCTQMGVNFTA